MEKIIKIVVTGPESTGKSALCAALAAHYKTIWVPEYSRKYLEEKGPEYEYGDLLSIAKGQIEAEAAAMEKLKETLQKHDSPKFLFVDTSMYVMKIWSEFVFQKCDHFILDRIAESTVDAFLLCNTDLPWQQDPLRTYPDLSVRQQIFKHYLDALNNQHIPWTLISGEGNKRAKSAIDFLDRLQTNYI